MYKKIDGSLAIISMYRNDLTNEKTRAAIINEISTIQMLKHSSFNSLFLLPELTFKLDNRVCFLYGYLTKKTLFDCINESKKLNEKTIPLIQKQIFEAIIFLHQNCKIAHRDIKPGNILFIKNQIKVGDFGSTIFTETIDTSKKNLSSFFGMTAKYINPKFYSFIKKSKEDEKELIKKDFINSLFCTGQKKFS